jgi:putative DNA primase/helicase
LLYDPLPGVTWPAVSEKPTRADVSTALATLLEPVAEFPFVASTDRVAYLAAVLTLLARHTIAGPVPMFAIRAPTPATGKGLLASVISLIGTGREAAVSTLTEDSAEWRKLLLTLAIEGAPVVLLDNLSGAVGSDHLAAALTAQVWMDRRLGSNEVVRAPLTTTWLATGNNLTFKRTLGRRVIPIDLNAKVERPEDRQFKIANLPAHVRAERPRYIAAGLTLLRAYHVAGSPRHDAGPRMGSFEAWDDLVRGALIWLGVADPASTDDNKGRGRIRAQSDDDQAELLELLAALGEHFEMHTMWKARDVIDLIADPGGGLTGRREVARLRDAISTIAPPKQPTSTPTPEALGRALRSYMDRPANGRVLRSQVQRGGLRLWNISGVGSQG